MPQIQNIITSYLKNVIKIPTSYMWGSTVPSGSINDQAWKTHKRGLSDENIHREQLISPVFHIFNINL